MFRRRLPLSRGVAALAAAALSLAACGADDGGDGGADAKPLALGTEAVVEYVTQASGETPAVNTKLGVTALAVRKGSQAELAQGGLEVDAEDNSTTPYYVDVRYANKGSQALKRDLSVAMEDAEGNSIPTTLVFGIANKPFKPCENVATGVLEPGQSYEECTLFLLPAGKQVGKVRFVSQGADAKITFTDWKP